MPDNNNTDNQVFVKMDLSTSDLAAANAKKLEALFPNCVVETLDGDGNIQRSIDVDVLRKELSIVDDDRTERYQMTWPGKAESIVKGNTPIDKTLRPYPDDDESVDFDTTQNLFIEGDNLDALKLLQETYLGKVKMIYIDPPYNTGNDFVYDDSIVADKDEFAKGSAHIGEEGGRLVSNPESNGRFHSDWLSMIYPRLRLARNLLSDDGVIFISIDENEGANLKKLCDEVFGERNAFNQTIWGKGNAQSDADNIQKNHEYIIGYAKNIDNVNLTVKETKSYTACHDDFGAYYIGSGITTGGEGGTLNRRPNLGYTIYYNSESKDIIALQDYDVELAKLVIMRTKYIETMKIC